MIELFRQLYQQDRSSGAKADAAQAEREVSRYSDRIRELESTINRLALASQAMWELLQNRVGITEQELIAKIAEIDLRDGAEDQRISTRLITCPNCHQTLTTKHTRCIYCGTELPKQHVFQ